MANYIFPHAGEKGRVVAHGIRNMHFNKYINVYLFIKQKPLLSYLDVNNVYKNLQTLSDKCSKILRYVLCIFRDI